MPRSTFGPPSARSTLCVGASTLLAIGTAGCTRGVLYPAGPVSEAIRTITLNAVAIMLAIVIPTMVVTIAFAWWFRASNSRAVYRPDWSYSGKIELVVWSIPTIVVLFLAGVIIVGSYRLDPARPLGSDRPLEVQVVSLDWKWLFIYPEQRVATVNELVIARTGPSRSVVPIDPDQPFQSIPISVWTVWRGVTAPVG